MGGIDNASAFPRGGSGIKTKRFSSGGASGQRTSSASLLKRKSGPSFKAKSLYRSKLKPSVKKPKAKPDGTKAKLANRSASSDLTPSRFNVSEDFVALCCVKAVKDDHLLVQLPGGVLGTVKLAEISSVLKGILEQSDVDGLEDFSLEKLFRVHQILACRVTSCGENRSISLTSDPKAINGSLPASRVRPGMVLQGVVKSKEDRGHILDLGIKSLIGFIPIVAEKGPVKKSSRHELAVGELVWCAVFEVTGEEPNMVAKVTVAPEEVSRASITGKVDVPKNLLFPGYRVTAVVVKTDEGAVQPFSQNPHDSIVKLKLLDKFDGYVLREHFPKPGRPDGGLVQGGHIACRILFLNANGEFCVTLNNKICKDFACPSVDADHTEPTSAKILGYSGSRLHVKSSEGVVGIVPLYLLSDDSKVKVKDPDFDVTRSYPLGAEFRCRLVGANHMDGAAVFSFRNSDITAKFLRSEDLKPGQEVEGTVAEVKQTGIVVQLSHLLTGFIPAELATSVSPKSLGKGRALMFPAGKVLKCRVWSVQDSGRILLTCRKDLSDVKSIPNGHWPGETVRILRKAPGKSHEGKVIPVLVVAGFRDGLLCITYQGIRCWVPRENLRDPDPSERQLSKFYPNGMVFCAKIASFHPDGENVKRKGEMTMDARFLCHMTGSRGSSSTPGADSSTAAASESVPAVELGASYPMIVTRKRKGALELTADLDGRNAPVEITLSHLSDFPDIASAYLRYLPVGAPMARPRCWRIPPKGCPQFTAKRPLLQLLKGQEEGLLPRSGKSVEMDSLVAGVVYNSDDKFVYLYVPYAAPYDEAFVHLRNVSDEFLKSVQDCGVGVKPGTTVVGKVIGRKEFKKNGKKKLELTLKPSKVCKDRDEAALTYMKEYFVAYDGLCSKAFPSVVEKHLQKPSLDVEVRAQYLGGEGSPSWEHRVKLLDADVSEPEVEKVVVVIPPSCSRLCETPKKGQSVVCCVVHFRVKDRTLMLIPKAILKKAKKVVGSAGDDGKSRARIVIKQPDMFILLTRDGRLVYATCKAHLCDVYDKSAMFQVDEEVPFEDCIEEDGGRLLCKKRIRTRPTHQKDEGQEAAEREKAKETGKKRRLSEGSSQESDKQGDDRVPEEEEAEDDESSADPSPKKKSKKKKKQRKERADSVRSEEEEAKADEDTVVAAVELTADGEETPRTQSNIIFDLVNRRGLSVGSKFDWSQGVVLEPSSKSFVEAFSDPQLVKPGKRTGDEERREEDMLRNMEEELMDPLRAPKTTEDFDRLVLSSPNSSLCWIKYMVFHLQAGELEEARVVARRALRTINVREERERLNVWVALLNMENLYGSNDTMEETFAEAVRTNDDLAVYKRTVDIYDQSGKLDKAEALFEKMVKKYKTDKDAWIMYATLHMKHGQCEKARRVLDRALKSLPESTSLDMLSKSAQLEMKYGDPERGKTLYEQLLKACPKRVDVLNVYVDALVKQGNVDGARAVLERATRSSVKMSKMKSVYAKYLAFESQHGTLEQQQAVREAGEVYLLGKVE